MRAEIISVGTELLLGHIEDTNAPYLSKALSTLGIDVFHRVTVGDNRDRLVETLKTALSRADYVITIGGLGPTEDDLTREAIADVLGECLVADPNAERTIRDSFQRRGITFAQSNLKQALKPESGLLIPNPAGTAPGLIVEKNGKTVIALPGPPGEFIPMVESSVVSHLSKKTTGHTSVIVSRTLRLCGIGESAAEERIKDLLASANPTIAPCAKSGEVHFRITAKASDTQDAAGMISNLETAVRERLGDYIYGVDEETLEAVVIRMLVEKNLKIALAESCTGGLVSHRLTNVPGSSETFLAGVVAYSNQAKSDFLDVPPQLIREHGAVSPQVAEMMADGAARRTGADISIGITGIAGPGGGSSEKPVGLVYIGLKTPESLASSRSMFVGNRLQIKERAALAAMNMVRMYLLQGASAI